jgi:hypothetical protein
VLNKIPIGDKQKMKEIFGNYNVYPLENSLLHLNLVNILSTRIIFCLFLIENMPNLLTFFLLKYVKKVLFDICNNPTEEIIMIRKCILDFYTMLLNISNKYSYPDS